MHPSRARSISPAQLITCLLFLTNDSQSSRLRTTGRRELLLLSGRLNGLLLHCVKVLTTILSLNFIKVQKLNYSIQKIVSQSCIEGRHFLPCKHQPDCSHQIEQNSELYYIYRYRYCTYKWLYLGIIHAVHIFGN